MLTIGTFRRVVSFNKTLCLVTPVVKKESIKTFKATLSENATTAQRKIHNITKSN